MQKLVHEAESAALATVIGGHPAVAAARVTRRANGLGSTAWIAPDRRAARMLHRSTELEAAERLGVLAWHEPAKGLRVAGLNRGETDFLYREIFTDGFYFRGDTALPPGAVVVDVGANIGMFTLRVAQWSPGARIVAVEPVTELAEAVRINADLHEAAVTVVCAALGSSESEAEFTFYPHNSVMSGRFADSADDVAVLKGYLLTDRDAAGGAPLDGAQLDRLSSDRMVPEQRRVPVTTLAKVASDCGLEHIDLLKIDVEKSELEVLEGVGDALWPRVDRVVVEVYDIDGRLAAVVDLLRAQGFTVESDQDPRLALTPLYVVYAHRPSALDVPVEPVPTVMSTNGPTLRELEQELRELITQALPSAELPAYFTLVTELTLADDQTEATPLPAPTTRRTAVLGDAWAALFGREAVEVEADFFDLGGTSLTALRLLDLVEEQLGEGALTPEMIFTASTFGELSAAIEAGGADHRDKELPGA